jgi:hypothetical protein
MNLSALCLSGGGIRSATFALGVLQALSRRTTGAGTNLLHEFDYLSTVSGGGYIGSWWSAWICRARQNGQDATAQLAAARTAQDPEPKPVQHLRNFSNFLTPRLGVFSADTWTLIAIYLRNLLLNWLVFIPWLLAALLVPRLCVSAVSAVSAVECKPPQWMAWIMFGLGLIAALFPALFVAFYRPTIDGNKGIKQHTLNQFLWRCFIPLILSSVLLTIWWAWHNRPGNPAEPAHERWWRHPLRWFLLLGLIPNIFAIVAHRTTHTQQTRKPGRWPWAEEVAALLSGTVAGCVAWIIANSWHPDFSNPTSLLCYVCFATPVLLCIFLLNAALYVGYGSSEMDDDDREWFSRIGAHVLAFAGVWAISAAVVLLVPGMLLDLYYVLVPIGSAASLYTLLVGTSSNTPANKDEARRAGWVALLLQYGLTVLAPVFVLFLFALLSLLTTFAIDQIPPPSTWNIFADPCAAAHAEAPQLTTLPTRHDSAWHQGVTFHSSLLVVFPLFVGLIAVGWTTARWIQLNRFTLHATYRNRLVRAYLGASRPDRAHSPTVHRFTGFDREDNVEMFKLRDNRPFHVINMALNLNSDRDHLGWQERKAEPFTVTPLHCGSSDRDMGYRRSEVYGGSEDSSGPISLGTAFAISGAAVSPNMGYNTSSAVAFLLSLFNVRLGWWLGNTRQTVNNKPNDTFKRAHPRNSAMPLVNEALGFTDNDHPYIYLSDGGHFENLGLYEMVLRRCHTIVLSDAGRDPAAAFDDLGNAIRKIRIDLGIDIKFQGRIRIFSRTGKEIGKHCALAKIIYSDVDAGAPDGDLLYIKPSIYGEEPPDIYNYAQACKDFPHESTGDQWFSESQFESYRALGSHIVDTICAGKTVSTLQDLLNAARAHIGTAGRPLITAVSHASGPANTPDTVTIQGEGFAAGAQVLINNQPQPNTVISGDGKQITVMLTAPLPSATHHVTVFNPDRPSSTWTFAT